MNINVDMFHNNDICGKEYHVSYYLVPSNMRTRDDYTYNFTGVVENFNPNAVSVFWNKDKKEILVINTSLINIMRPVKNTSKL